MKWNISDEIFSRDLEALVKGKTESIQEVYEKTLADGFTTLIFNVTITVEK